MTTVADALTPVRRAGPQLIGPACLGAGLLIVVGWWLGPTLTAVAVGVPLALAAAVALSARPAAVLVLMVAVEVSNATNVLYDHFARTFHASLALGVLTLARLLVTDAAARRALRRFLPVVGALLGCFLVGQLLAVTVSELPAVSTELLQRNAVDALFVVVVAALAIAVRRPWAVAAAIAGAFALLSVLGLVNELVFDGTATFAGFATVTTASGELTTTLRHGGPLPDSNFWGRHLVLGLPLGLALLTRALARRPGLRWPVVGWSAAVLAMLGAVYLTQSRGTFVAVLVAVGCWLAAAGPAVRRRALPLLALLAPVPFLPGIGDRFVALVADITDRTAGYAADPSVLGRAAAQEIAWAMFRGKPILGVGPGAYTDLVPRYAGIVPTAVLEPTDAPHNLYLQLAAESGVIGLAAWLAMFAGFALLAGRAAARFGAAGEPWRAHRPLAAAVLAGLAAWAVASVFLHLAYFRTLGVVFALAAAVAAEAAGLPRRARAAGRAAPRSRPAPLVAAAVLLGATAGLATMLARTEQPTVTATRLVTLAPTVDPYAWNAYSYDVRSRLPVLPTFAALAVDPRRADAPGAAVAAVPDPVRGTIRISAQADDEATARRRLDAALVEAGDRVRASGAARAYSLAPVGAVQSEPGAYHPAASWAAALPAALAGGAAAGLAAVAAVRGRRRPPARQETT